MRAHTHTHRVTTCSFFYDWSGCCFILPSTVPETSLFGSNKLSTQLNSSSRDLLKNAMFGILIRKTNFYSLDKEGAGCIITPATKELPFFSLLNTIKLKKERKKEKNCSIIFVLLKTSSRLSSHARRPSWMLTQMNKRKKKGGPLSVNDFASSFSHSDNKNPIVWNGHMVATTVAIYLFEKK